MDTIYIIESCNSFDERETIAVSSSKEKADLIIQCLEFDDCSADSYSIREFRVDSVLDHFRAKLEEDLKYYHKASELLKKLESS